METQHSKACEIKGALGAFIVVDFSGNMRRDYNPQLKELEKEQNKPKITKINDKYTVEKT